MPDVSHICGQDLQLSATGDLLLVDGTVLGEQRVLRRLLTNRGDYVFHLDYGASLPARVGDLLNIPDLNAAIRAQIFQEAVVSQSPPPTIEVIKSGIGSVVINITYQDAFTGQQASLSFDPSQ